MIKFKQTFFILLTLLLLGLFFNCRKWEKYDYVNTNRLTFTIDVKGKKYTKDYIYDKIHLWLAEKYITSSKLIDYANKPKGIIVANGTDSHTFIDTLGTDVKATYNHKTKILIKDNKLRLKRVLTGGYSYTSEEKGKYVSDHSYLPIDNVVEDTKKEANKLYNYLIDSW